MTEAAAKPASTLRSISAPHSAVPILRYTRPWMAPYQTDAIFNDKRYSIIEATTKAGKTAGCLVWLLEEAMQGKKGDNFWWVAPVNTQADIAFVRARNGLPRDVYRVDLTHKTMTLSNGAVVWFKSSDNPDTLYGDDVKAAVIDEASRCKEEAWYAVRTTLTATRGKLRIIGNVKGKKNWFYALARRAEGGEADMYYSKMTANDAVAAGILAQEEIDDARRVLPDLVFRELYMAEPSDDGSNPFSIEAIRKCVAPLSAQRPAVWGWDLAKSVDWTVGIALDGGGDTCRFHRFQMSWDATMTQISAVTGNMPALVDSSGVGDPIVEMLQKKPGTKFEGYTFSGPSKQKLMEGLAVAIQSGSVSFPDGPIRQELENFEFEYTRTGVRYSAPEGFHDDCVCSLALAVMHRSHARAPMRVSAGVLQRAATPMQPMRRFR